VKRQSVSHHSASVNDSDGAVAQRFCVELAASKAVRLEKQVREGEADGVLEVPALELKVVLGEVHSLVPDHPR
jgi:ATP-dependent helicase YprA (DUF1998 family)